MAERIGPPGVEPRACQICPLVGIGRRSPRENTGSARASPAQGKGAVIPALLDFDPFVAENPQGPGEFCRQRCPRRLRCLATWLNALPTGGKNRPKADWGEMGQYQGGLVLSGKSRLRLSGNCRENM